MHQTTTTAALEVGNNYAKNKQWPNAAAAYTAALELQYASLLAPASDSIALEKPTQDALMWVYRCAMKEGPISKCDLGSTNDSEPGRTHRERLCALRQTLADLFYPQEDSEQRAALLRSNDITAIPHIGTSPRHWTVIYHSVRTNDYEYEDIADHMIGVKVNYIDSSAPTFAFALKLRSPEEADAVEIDDAHRARLAYIWAHLADASSYTTMGLYRVSTVVITESLAAMFQRAYAFQVALAIQPDYRWALAHLGDFYRNVANGWGQPEPVRFDFYAKAIDYLLTSIGELGRGSESGKEPPPLAASSAWAIAHLGAAIVNARAFTGVGPCAAENKPDSSNKFDVLEQLAMQWKLSGKPKGGGPGSTSLWLMKKARDYLVDAQVLQGFFYPWAQNYQGDALLLITMLDQYAPNKPLAQLSSAQLLHSFVLQPELATQLFEPGQLFRNPNFEFGVLYFSTKKYSLSWQNTWVGMQYLFKFDFVSGVQALLGTTIMAMASAGHMREETGAAESYPLLGEGGFLRMHANPGRPHTRFDLPPDIIGTKAGLATFIEDVFVTFGKPTVTPLLLLPDDPQDDAWTTKIRVGMTATQEVFFVFANLLQLTGGSQVVIDELYCFIDAIGDRLGTGERYPSASAVSREDAELMVKLYGDSLYALIVFGSATFNVRAKRQQLAEVPVVEVPGA